jgi:putative tryptophan/tyrosine transport system substrate-binding protein
MTGKILIWLLVTFLLITISLAQAQQPKKIYRIAYLSHRHGIGPDEEAFRQRLRELGYIEGKNLVFEWRFKNGRLDLHPERAAELVRLKVDCIVTMGVAPTRAAKQASGTIPIVMGNASDDPVRLGLIASLARPGGNVTGFIDIAPDLAGKRLELLKETVPKATYAAIVWSPASPVATTQVKQIETAAPAIGVQLQLLEVRSPDDLENAFRAAGNGRAGALIVVSFGFVINHQEQIVNLATKNRLPAVS